MQSYNKSLYRQGGLAMLKSFAKITIAAAALLLVTFSTNSIAGGLYGNIGYGHHPIHVVIGYNGHDKQYSHRRNHHKRYHNHKRRHIQRHHHYNKHAYRHGHGKRHYYNQPRRYCRSGY